MLRAAAVQGPKRKSKRHKSTADTKKEKKKEPTGAVRAGPFELAGTIQNAIDECLPRVREPEMPKLTRRRCCSTSILLCFLPLSSA